MIAVMDEAAPADNAGIYYVVTAAIILDPINAKEGLSTVLPPGRLRPFHWVSEGVQARALMLDLLVASGVAAHVVVHYPTGRRRQEQARKAAISELIRLVIADGAEELIIESRSARDDARDRQTLIEVLHEVDAPLRYRWEKKSEPLLWIADALCGVIKEYLLGQDTSLLERLQAEHVLGDLRYRHAPNPGNA
jgi:hypothetical protein